MTLEQVIGIVEDHTGKTVTADSKLSELGMDSLEFLELMVLLTIPDEVVPNINTVSDLFAAVSEAVYDRVDGLWHKRGHWNYETSSYEPSL